MQTPSRFCNLCGLPLKYGKISADFSNQTYTFCCLGCKQVFSMLMEAAGTDDPTQFKHTELFKRCREMGVIPGSEKDLARYAPTGPEADTHHRARANEKTPGINLNTPSHLLHLNLKVGGMWCQACAWVIEEILAKKSGVANVRCTFSTDRLSCAYDPVKSSPKQIIRAIEKLGYSTANPEDPAAFRKQQKGEFIRFAITAFLSVNVMMLSFALYSGFFTQLSADNAQKISWPIFFMATVALGYGGLNLLKRAWQGLASGIFGMEILVMAGALSAYFYSIFNLMTGSIHLYFDTATMLVTLVLLGKWLESRAKNQTRESLEAFFSLLPTKVRIITEKFPNGRYTTTDQLAERDRFRVREDEITPADGRIIAGAGIVDESSLTGEAVPITKKPGHPIIAGSRVINGDLTIRAQAVGSESTLGQMIQIIQEALEDKTPLEGQTERALRWLVPLIFTLAVGTGIGCYFLGFSADTALIRSITVMVISCPCALGIAIPLVRVAGISLAGKKGILVREFSAFESVSNLDHIVFDKTGTLTTGKWRLLEVIPEKPFSREKVLALAAGLEAESDHPIGVEIRKLTTEEGITADNVSHITEHQNGIAGQLNGQKVRIGNRAFTEIDKQLPQTRLKDSDMDIAPSKVYLRLDRTVCAVLIFGDRLRKNSESTIASLGSAGYGLSIISGDADKTTAAIGARLGIEYTEGGKLPEEKARFISRLRKRGHTVAMVGDGVNDAPALAQADLAVALHSGSQLVKETAHVTLMRGDPAQLLDHLELAKRVNRKVKQNLWCAFIYNFFAIPVAMTGLLSPLVAVCAMLCSSLSVIGNTLLLIRKT
jgi:P-type Cu+ transporter